MYKRTKICLVIAALCICIFSFKVYAQGDNNPNPLINLALIDGATVSGSIPDEQARGIPTDILWNPSTNDWASPSDWHEYGMAYGETMAAAKENPLYWQVVWTEAKNVNYITCSGVYPNQPQPTTGWAVQILADDEWQDLAKAHNGWRADTLSGVGYGKPTQTNWVWDGQLVWRGLEPIVTKGIRFTAYANPDSLADGKESFADSLWSFAWTGRDFGPGTPKSVLIQYLDFSEETADNKLDPLANLALLDEAVVSADFQEWDFTNERGQPADILYDPVKDDYHNKNTYWGEFGYPYDYDAGFPEGPDDGFQYIVEWPVPKKVNYFTWGGTWGSQAQPNTPWALQYWNGDIWVTVMEGIGGGLYSTGNDEEWPYTPGVDSDAQSIWMVPVADAISTKKMRLAAWSDGSIPLWSFHIRCRGGVCINIDDSENPFKAVLVQYAEIVDPTTAVETSDGIHPADFALHQNYPNPFNPVTAIQFDLPQQGHVTVCIYDILGRKVATIMNQRLNAGQHEIQFDAAGLASGIYFYQIRMGKYCATKKMLLSR